MTTTALAWITLLVYFGVTGGLALRAARRSSSVATFAVGTKAIPAWVIGLSLAAQLTSVATFVVNPGLVYAYGLSALVGYGVAAGLGLTLGLIVLSRRFLSHGTRVAALTVPQWIGSRFQSPGLRLAFAVLSLGLVTFATLIVVGISLVWGPLLGLSPQVTAVGLLAVVATGVMVGGATGHAWVNAAQAMVMLAAAGIMLGSGASAVIDGSLLARVATIDPALVHVPNAASPLFRSWFEVFVCNFIVGLALVCQPHVMSKVLFLKSERDVRAYLTTAVLCGLVFTSLLVTGLYARLDLTDLVRIDRAIPTWMATKFSPNVQVFLAAGVLCAGLSTLEGILLALSSIISVDVYPRFTTHASDRVALGLGRGAVAMLAAVTAGLAIWQIDHPTGGTVALFAQYGVYLLFSASFVPMAAGMFLPAVSTRTITLSVVIAVTVYLGLSIGRVSMYSNNPGVLAAAAILAACILVAVSEGFRSRVAASR